MKKLVQEREVICGSWDWEKKKGLKSFFVLFFSYIFQFFQWLYFNYIVGWFSFKYGFFVIKWVDFFVGFSCRFMNNYYFY